MAWGATLTYVSGALLISFYAAPHLQHWWLVVGFWAALGGIYWAAGLFIAMQFKCRWEAADRLVVFRRIRTRLSQVTSDELFNRRFGQSKELPRCPDDPECQRCHGSRPRRPDTELAACPRCPQYPAFIEEEIRDRGRRREKAVARTLWKKVWNKLCGRGNRDGGWLPILQFYWVGKRRRSEIASYMILFIATISAGVFVLFPQENEDQTRTQHSVNIVVTPDPMLSWRVAKEISTRWAGGIGAYTGALGPGPKFAVWTVPTMGSIAEARQAEAIPAQ